VHEVQYEVRDVLIRSRFIQAVSTEARLDITLNDFRRLLTYFQVMPSLIDFISVFAIKNREPPDLRFSGFHERVYLHQGLTPVTIEVDYLGLSGRNYQLCYNLKSMANKSEEYGDLERLKRENWEWSSRQMVIHHQFDVLKGTTLWILTMARSELQERVEKLIGPNSRRGDRDFTSAESSFCASLAVHILLAQAASEGWRGHLRWLEQVLEKKASLMNTDGVKAIHKVRPPLTSLVIIHRLTKPCLWATTTPIPLSSSSYKRKKTR
jgi:hypothetical protein